VNSIALHNPDYQPLDQSLIQAYCGFYDQYEDSDYQVARTAQPKDKLDVISRYIGLVGMDIGRGWGADHTVNEDLAKLYNGLKEGLPRAYDNRHQAPGRLATRLGLIQTVNLLRAREDPFMVAVEQQITHWNNIQQLEENLAAVESYSRTKSKSATPASVEHSQRQRGLINELTAEAVLGRQASSSQLSLRALLHHSRNRLGPLSYNNLLVTLAPGGAAQPYRIQVKAGCIGACPERENPQLLAKHRSQYAPEIVLVSGHCDLGVILDETKRGRSYGGHIYPAASLLVEEVRDQGSSESIDMLNEYSASLLQTVTLDMSRRGTAT
jgi:hypothetical protein